MRMKTEGGKRKDYLENESLGEGNRINNSHYMNRGV